MRDPPSIPIQSSEKMEALGMGPRSRIPSFAPHPKKKRRRRKGSWRNGIVWRLTLKYSSTFSTTFLSSFIFGGFSEDEAFVCCCLKFPNRHAPPAQVKKKAPTIPNWYLAVSALEASGWEMETPGISAVVSIAARIKLFHLPRTTMGLRGMVAQEKNDEKQIDGKIVMIWTYF